MKTTLRLDDGLFRQVKRLAAETQRTMTAVFEDAVREMLARRQKSTRGAPLRLPVFHGKGLQPGVDLDHSAGLLDMMEGLRGQGRHIEEGDGTRNCGFSSTNIHCDVKCRFVFQPYRDTSAFIRSRALKVIIISV